MKKFLFSGYEVQVNSNNRVAFFNFLIKHNIQIFELKIVDDEVLRFFVSAKNYLKLLSIKNRMCYNIVVINRFGTKKLQHFVRTRAGVVAGLVLSAILLFFVNMFTFNYKILGVEQLSHQQVISALKDFGIKINAINNFDNAELEQFLKRELDEISIVSVVKNGTTIIVNIKEKLPKLEVEFVPIVANYNMMIEEISVFAGWSKFVAGDIVKAGEVLVEPYFVDESGIKTDCKPTANIVASTWFSHSVEFKEKETLRVRSGNKIVNTSYSFANKIVFETNSPNKFEHYEEEVSVVSAFKNLFLPIVIKKSVIYELVEVEIERNFELVRDDVIADAFEKAFAKVPQHLSVKSEEFSVTKVGKIYLVNAYLKCKIRIGGDMGESNDI